MARFGIHLLLLSVAVAVSARVLATIGRGAGIITAVMVVALALAAPIALDLWAKVEADGDELRWRNRVVTRKVAWGDVAGFHWGTRGVELERTDGRRHHLRALGLRYLGSKRLAEARVVRLEELRRRAG